MALLALIAHDAKKNDLIEFASANLQMLSRFDLIATATTGSHLEKLPQLRITKMLSGPKGGDLQIGALIAEAKVSGVIFLRDPLTAHPHEPDIAALMKICDVQDVPLATNLATARLLIQGLEKR